MQTGIDELRRFKIFAELEEEDFESIGRSHTSGFDTAERTDHRRIPADHLYRS